MSQSVGELFINLGIKGADTAFKALSSIKNAVTDMSAAGIAAKASVLGAVYALEQFTSQSAAYGNSLQNFNTLTGLSVVKTQQFAEAIREVTHVDGTTAATNFLKNFQEKVAAWRMQGRVHGSFVSQFIGLAGIDINDPDPFHWFAAIQKFSQRANAAGMNIGTQNAILQSMGISPEVIETARKFTGDISTITKNVESAGQIKQLSNVAAEFSDFWTRLQKVRDLLTAKWGLPIIHELNVGLDLLEKWDKAIWRIYKNPLFSLKHSLAETILGDFSEEMRAQHIGVPWAYTPEKSEKEGGIKAFFRSLLDSDYKKFENNLPSSPAVKPGPLGKPGANNSIHVNVNQYGVKDTFSGTDQHAQEVARAYYQISTIGQVA